MDERGFYPHITAFRPAYCKEGRSHVGLHVLVVETHDLDKVLQSCNHHLEEEEERGGFEGRLYYWHQPPDQDIVWLHTPPA